MLNRRKQKPISRFAIDPGAHRTRFYSATEGLLLDQPSVAALDMDHPHGGSEAVTAFGDQALALLSSGNTAMREIQPVHSDQRNDLGLRVKMIHYFLDRARRTGLISKIPEISLVLPHYFDEKTNVELQHACFAAGAGSVEVQDAYLAALYGSGLSQSDPCVMIDFGATGSRLVAFSNGGVAHYEQLPCGGDAVDQAIVDGMLTRFDLQISNETAREIKHNIAAATPQSFVQCTRNSCQITCLSVSTNKTTTFRIGSETVSELLQPLLTTLKDSIKVAFNAIDGDVKDAAYETGIQLCGGGAMLSRIDQLVMSATDLPVETVNRPLTCSVRGAASTLVEKLPPVELIETA